MNRLLLAATLLLLASGCSESASSDSRERRGALEAETSRSAMKPGPAAPGKEAAARTNGAPVSPPINTEASRRKIISTAGIDLVVDNLSEAEAKLEVLVQQSQGFVSQSHIDSHSAAPRSGTWQVRIPANRFSDFVHRVVALGESLNSRTNSDDISDAYFDTRVRIENKKVQVERLQKIVKEQTGKLADVLEAERELGRVTTELEQLKGTVNRWDDQVALSTVNITMRERTKYVPAETPTFGRRIALTFGNSLDTLIVVSQDLVLVAVALTPWVPLIVLFVATMWFLHRLGRPRRRASMAADATSSRAGGTVPGP